MLELLVGLRVDSNTATITNRLQALTINLQDQVMGLDDYMDDPEAFDLGSFRYIQRESERYCDQAIHTLKMLHEAMMQERLKKSQMGDRTLLSSQQNSAPINTPTSGHEPQSQAVVNGQSLGSSPWKRSASSESITLGGEYAQRPKINTVVNGQSFQETALPTPSSYGAFKAMSPGNSSNMPAKQSMPLPPPPPPPPPASVWQLPASMSSEAPKRTSRSIERKLVGSGDGKPLSTTESPSRQRAESAGASSLHIASATSESAKPLTIPEEMELSIIKSEEVERQRLKNEEFLEKRRRSRLFFQQEFHQIRHNSRQSISTVQSSEGNRFSSSTGILSPSDFVASPLTQSRPESELLMGRSQSREGQEQLTSDRNPRFSTATTDSRPSIASDNMSVRPGNLTRQESGEPMMFGPPESPPTSDRGSNANANSLDWGILAHTLRTPDFGRGVEDGIQVIGPGLVSDPGLMLAAEVGRGELPVTPAISLQAVEYPIGQDSSFYKYGGFCEGAKMLLTGQDPLKIQKKPGVR